MPHPPPDRSQNHPIAGQTLVDGVYGPGNRVRGIITVDDRSIYRVRTERWDTSDWDVGGSPFWSHVSGPAFTDTLERAREICHDEIRAAVGELE